MFQMQPLISSGAGADAAVRLDASLALAFERRDIDGVTVLRDVAQTPPLRVIRAFPVEDRSALVHMHNVSGGVLGGDKLALAVRVGAGANVQLTTTGATRLYRSREDALTAVQTNTIIVEEGGLLEYVPDPLIPFAGARFRQETRIQLEPDAGLFWWEILAPGREAHGECFAYEQIGLKTEIRADGKLIAHENVVLEPTKIRMDAIARLDVYRYWVTLYVCRVGPDTDWLGVEAQLRHLIVIHLDDVIVAILGNVNVRLHQAGARSRVALTRPRVQVVDRFDGRFDVFHRPPHQLGDFL